MVKDISLYLLIHFPALVFAEAENLDGDTLRGWCQVAYHEVELFVDRRVFIEVGVDILPENPQISLVTTIDGKAAVNLVEFIGAVYISLAVLYVRCDELYLFEGFNVFFIEKMYTALFYVD